MTGWPATHQRVLELFTKSWARPHPHAWDELLAEDVELIQPFARDCHGRAQWWEEARRLLSFTPDLTGEVLGWAARDDRMFINIRLHATVRGTPVTVHAVDQLHLDPSGTILRRESVFDTWPLMFTVLRHPTAWWSWWRSGLAPMLGRRRFLPKVTA